jgi:hypothetical protein
VDTLPLETICGIFCHLWWGTLTFWSPCYGLVASAVRKSSYCPHWSSALAAEISGPHPAWFLFVASNERDGLRDWSTQETGTVASDCRCYCLRTRALWSDSADSKLWFWANKAVYWKPWRTFRTNIRRSNKFILLMLGLFIRPGTCVYTATVAYFTRNCFSNRHPVLPICGRPNVKQP